MAGVLVRLTGPRGPVSGLLSEPRPGLAEAMLGLSPTMRFLTNGDVREGDLLTGPNGDQYQVTRVWPTEAGLVVELGRVT